MTPFPIATTILLAFAHAQQGVRAGVGFVRAFLPAMWSFALFCFVLAVGALGVWPRPRVHPGPRRAAGGAGCRLAPAPGGG
jgi:hypothetical protein